MEFLEGERVSFHRKEVFSHRKCVILGKKCSFWVEIHDFGATNWYFGVETCDSPSKRVRFLGGN